MGFEVSSKYHFFPHSCLNQLRAIRKMSPQISLFLIKLILETVTFVPHPEGRSSYNSSQSHGAKWYPAGSEQNICIFKEVKERRKGLGSDCPGVSR